MGIVQSELLSKFSKHTFVFPVTVLLHFLADLQVQWYSKSEQANQFNWWRFFSKYLLILSVLVSVRQLPTSQIAHSLTNQLTKL